MPTYCYRLGDGNEGNYPRFLITLTDHDDPFAALAVLVENRYIVGSRTRRYIRANVETDGEPEFGIRATVYEGPKGEQPFGAAWITAELEALTPEDLAHYEGQGLQSFDSLRDAIDRAAWRHYKQTARTPRDANHDPPPRPRTNPPAACRHHQVTWGTRTMLTPRARSLFPSWVNPADQCAALRALAVFAAQNPGLEFGNYGHLPSYRADARRITKDLQRCRDAMRSCVAYPVTDAQVIEAARHTFAGRLTLELRADGSVHVDYVTGQYFCTEYRAAVAAVLEQVSREAYARASEHQPA